MFGSQILEVGLGLIMVFLLVSLILTAVRETIETWTKTRSRDLERAIAELLDDHSGDGLRKRLYEHPLVYGLFQGPVSLTDFSKTGAVPAKPAGAARAQTAAVEEEPAKLAAAEGAPAPSDAGERTDATRLPSYIPRETFALALEHLLADGRATGRIATAYRALKRAAGDDPEQIRKGLEQWFDAAMDRASGWYRRRTQKILFWLGLAVALLLNINAFTIAQYLSTSDAARQQVVALGDAYLKDEAVAAALRNPAATPSEAAQGNDSGDGNAQADAEETAADGSTGVNESADGNESAGEEKAPVGQAGTSRQEQQPAKPLTSADVSRRLHDELNEIGLPIGWNAVQLRRFKDQLTGQGCLAGLGFAIMLLAGYLAVAFAATMGAPFWFDLLGKFMVIRSTVKPKEKSRDEASKDGGTGGAPVVPDPGSQAAG